jgi:hypothetical protein
MTRKSLCFAAAMMVASAEQAAGPMPVAQKCANLTEVATLARALAEENVDKQRALSILRRIYSIPDESSKGFARLVIESAYSDTAAPGEFAQKFEVICIASTGERPVARSPAGSAGRTKM